MPKIQKILFIIMAVPLACLVCIGYGEGGRFRTKLLLRWGGGGLENVRELTIHFVKRIPT